MFDNCSTLLSIDKWTVDTSAVTGTGSMFRDCSNLTSIDVSNFDTSNVTDMGGMFAGCAKLTSLDLTNFDFSKVETMYIMFQEASVLESVTGFAGKDIHSCTNVKYMFGYCKKIKDFDFSGVNLGGVTDMSTMFSSCNPESVSFKNADLSSVTNMSMMFNTYGGRLKTVDFGGCDLSNVTDVHNMFAMQTNLTDVTFGRTSKIQNADSMFLNTSVTTLPYISCSGDSVNISRFCGNTSTGSVVYEIRIDGGTITSMDYAFTNQPNIEMLTILSTIGLTAAPTQAFKGCTGLKQLFIPQENEYILAALQTDLPDYDWE